MNPRELAEASKRGILSPETVEYWRGKQREKAAAEGEQQLTAAAESRRAVSEFGELGIKELPQGKVFPYGGKQPASIEELLATQAEGRGGPQRFQQFAQGAGAEKALRGFQEGGGEQARQAWWEALTRPRVDTPTYEAQLKNIYDEMTRWGSLITEGAEPGMFQPAEVSPGLRGTAYQGLTQQAPRVMQELQNRLNTLLKQGQAGYEQTQQQRYPAPVEAEDPLQTYLKKYPFMKEWMRLSPSQRGFNPAITAPGARWM